MYVSCLQSFHMDDEGKQRLPPQSLPLGILFLRWVTKEQRTQEKPFTSPATDETNVDRGPAPGRKTASQITTVSHKLVCDRQKGS